MQNKNDSIKTFYDKEASQYFSDRYTGDTWEQQVYRDRKAIVLELLQEGAGYILDIGCGPGILTREFLLKKWDVCSVDLSLEMLKIGRELIKDIPGNAFWVKAEMEHLAFTNELFNCVTIIGVLGLATHPEVVLSEINRVVKKDGILVVQFPNEKCPSKLLHRLLTKLPKSLIRRSKKPFIARLQENNIDPYGLSPKKFILLLQKSGFEVMEKRFYDFRIPLLEKLSEKLAFKIMSYLHTLFSKSSYFGWLGEGMVFKCIKKQ